MKFRDLDLPITVEDNEDPVTIIMNTDPHERWMWYVNAANDDIEFDLLRLAAYPWCQRLEIILKQYSRKQILALHDRAEKLAEKYWVYDDVIDIAWVKERIRLALLYKSEIEAKGSLKHYRDKLI